MTELIVFPLELLDSSNLKAIKELLTLITLITNPGLRLLSTEIFNFK